METVKSITRGLILNAVILFSTMSGAAYAAPQDRLHQAPVPRCAKPVFYAQTANHKKEVEICIVTPSVSYSFGKVGAKTKKWILPFLRVIPLTNTRAIRSSVFRTLPSEMAIPTIRSQLARMMQENPLPPFMFLKVTRRPASSWQR